MKKLIYLTVFLLMLEFNATMGQYNNNFWPFGDSVLISWNSLTNPVLGNASFYCRNGSCSIGDNSGLIIYSGLIDNTLPNNAVVWNKYNRIIPNADYLFGSAWYHAGQLIPDPGNDSMIYCFTRKPENRKSIATGCRRTFWITGMKLKLLHAQYLKMS